MKKTILALGLMAGLLMAGQAQATLIDRGNGLIYDDVLNITWTQNANLCVTLNNCIPGPVALGTMTWADANTWAADLVFGGFSDWRLPSMDVNGDTTVVNCNGATELACRDNEYGYMFYQNLNGVLFQNKTNNQVGDGGVTINNIQSFYWSGTGFAPDPGFAWSFFFINGDQVPGDFDLGILNYVWAVRPGDSVAAVPEVGSGLLMGLGLMGMRLARRWRGR